MFKVSVQMEIVSKSTSKLGIQITAPITREAMAMAVIFFEKYANAVYFRMKYVLIPNKIK